MDIAGPQFAYKLAEAALSEDGQRMVALQEEFNGLPQGAEITAAEACCHIAWALKEEGKWDEFKSAFEGAGGKIEADSLTEQDCQRFGNHISDIVCETEKEKALLQGLYTKLRPIVDNIIRLPISSENLSILSGLLEELTAISEQSKQTGSMDGFSDFLNSCLFAEMRNIISVCKVSISMYRPMSDDAEQYLSVIQRNVDRFPGWLEYFYRKAYGLRTMPGVTFTIEFPVIDAPDKGVVQAEQDV